MNTLHSKTSFFTNYYFIVGAIAAILFVHFYVVAVYTSEWPYVDDYVTTLEFLNRYYDSTTFIGKLNAILAQWSEHRIGFGKSVTLLYQKLTGKVSFVGLSLLSNLSLVLFYLLLMLQVKKELRKYLFIPIALLLFQLQYYIAQQWLVTSSSFFYMLLFSISSLHFFRKGSFFWAILFGIIAIYSNANGFLILLGESILLALAKDWKWSAILFFSLCMCMWGYFIGYVPHENDKLMTFYYFKNPWPTILYTFMFIGSPLNLFNGLGAIMGALACLYFVWVTYTKYYERNSSVYLLLFMLLSTAALAALGRSFWGVEQALESRYKIFSIVVWLCILVSAAEEYISERLSFVYPVLLGACLLFNVGSYALSWKYMEAFQERKHLQYADIYTDKPIKVMSDAREILMKSIHEGYYASPSRVTKLP